MLYSRPIIVRTYRPGIAAGYAIYAADGITEIVGRTEVGVIARGGGEFIAFPTFNTEWGRYLIVQWSTLDGTLNYSGVIDQSTAPTVEAIDNQLSTTHGEGSWEGATVAPPGEGNSLADISQAIADAILDGKSTNVDGTVTVNHSVAELIEADKYFRRRKAEEERAANPVKTSPFGRMFKMVPPGANGV